VELSSDCVIYLERLFKHFKNQQTNKLEEVGLEKIFATLEKGIPWKVKSHTLFDQGITFDNWLGLWHKYFSESPREAFTSLVYVGYGGKLRNVVNVIKYKETDKLKVSKQTVFNCYVISHRNTVCFSFLL
jgi:hypothetical protein